MKHTDANIRINREETRSPHGLEKSSVDHMESASLAMRDCKKQRELAFVECEQERNICMTYQYFTHKGSSNDLPLACVPRNSGGMSSILSTSICKKFVLTIDSIM